MDTAKVGDGATVGYGSDCYPYTIVEISKSGKRITIQADDAVAMNNVSATEQQEWKITPNPEGAKMIASLRRDGSWRLLKDTTRVGVGHRRMYRDPSF